ncbi:MAG: hypothetical protein ABGZ17_25890 [Planctomycetaceae bacterium]
MLRNKKRPVVLVSGVLGVGLLIGMLIGLLPDWNTPGEGGNPETSKSAATDPPDAQASIVPANTSAATPAVEKLDILIDGHKFLIKSGKARVYRELKLGELIQKAQATTGDEDGVRVEVVRRKNSRASAEEALRNGLLEAGLKPLELDIQGELRP